MEEWTIKVQDAVPDVTPTKGPSYKSKLAKDGYPKLDGVSTVWELFRRSAEVYPNNNMLGMRDMTGGKAGPYIWETYAQVFEKTKYIASAFRSLGVEAKGRVGIYGANCSQWVIAMEACNSQSLYCVPLYDTLGADAIEFIVNHAEISTIVVQASKISTLISGITKCTDNVKTIVSMDEWDAASKSKAEELGIKTYSWNDFLALGKSSPVEPVPPSPEDICTIMYTSGTTGEPKGVLISHASVVAVIASSVAFTTLYHEKVGQSDVYLSYLPLAHIFDRVSEEFLIYNGGSIGFWQGDVKLLVDDIGELKPTFFTGVPRIFDRIASGVRSKIDAASPIAKFLFNFGYGRKLDRLRHGHSYDKAAPISDLLVFNKVKQKLGGRVKIIISGAAPLAPHVEEFLRVAMCAPVVQGYGMTETCAGSFISIPGNMKQAGTVGPPMPVGEVRLESVPEMKYDALGTPPRGEVCIKGPSLFAGYYKRQDLTDEAFDADGWFHTGDVGEWQADGAMKIIDRKKNIFKLAQGEYVAVENLENVYGLCAAVDQAWVYGNSFESVLVAVVVPNEPALLDWAKQNGVSGDLASLCQNARAKEHILAELVAVGKKGKLRGFELIKALHLEPVPFDMERDLLTPTFKKKRPQLLDYYKTQIDSMYADLKAAEAAKELKRT
eukprot:jgi/Mesen1/1210/ME000128S00185